MEHPDYWLTFGNPFEIERVDVTYPVHFYGHVRPATDADRKSGIKGQVRCYYE